MPAEFIRCVNCSVFFMKDEENNTKCTKCRRDSNVPESPKERLRLLRNLLRDSAILGQMLTIPQLAEQSGMSDTVIWEFINSGQLDVASFNDPEVRDFVVKRRRERMKAQTRNTQAVASEAEPKKKRGGFHKRPEH